MRHTDGFDIGHFLFFALPSRVSVHGSWKRSEEKKREDI
jgi:hypothetical protein